MDIGSALVILGWFIIILGGLLGILSYRAHDEKKYYSGYKFSNNNEYKYLSKYEAYIENGSPIYQTNMVHLYVTNEAVIVQKESIKKGYYSIAYNINNTSSILVSKEEILFGFKNTLKIYHVAKNIKSPCEISLKSYMDENVLSMIENLSEKDLMSSTKMERDFYKL